MSTSSFDAFKAELGSLLGALTSHRPKAVRDDQLRERFRTLFRTWVLVVRPELEPHLKARRGFLKLDAEIESLVRLASGIETADEYAKRLNRAISLAERLVLYLPPTGAVQPMRPFAKDNLFIPEISDLPLQFTPNFIVGWKREMQSFVRTHAFDKSVFIMIRYRKRNKPLIEGIKSALSKNGFVGVLASETNLTRDLYNPIACLLCCARGIAVFDKAETDQVFNPNVAYELGIMHILDRNCLILKHKQLKSLHADIVMRLYQEYATPIGASSIVREWITSAQ